MRMFKFNVSQQGYSFNFAKKMHPNVAAVSYCSFLISASKNGNELILDFFKGIQLNCVIGRDVSMGRGGGGGVTPPPNNFSELVKDII